MDKHPMLERYERECERIRQWVGQNPDHDPLPMNIALNGYRNPPPFDIRLATLMDDMALAIRALSHAAGQDGVAWQCRLIAIATGEVVDDWRECSKESFDVDGGRPRDGAYLRTEYRALYLPPAQPPASAEVGRDAERTTPAAEQGEGVK